MTCIRIFSSDSRFSQKDDNLNRPVFASLTTYFYKIIYENMFYVEIVINLLLKDNVKLKISYPYLCVVGVIEVENPLLSSFDYPESWASNKQGHP